MWTGAAPAPAAGPPSVRSHDANTRNYCMITHPRLPGHERRGGVRCEIASRGLRPMDVIG